jgi:hypothetical protein
LGRQERCFLLDRDGARKIAEQALDPRCAIADERVVELNDGWYFPNKSLVGPLAGSHGVIINKRTGRLFTLGSAFPPQRDLDLYDRGFQFSCSSKRKPRLGELEPVVPY